MRPVATIIILGVFGFFTFSCNDPGRSDSGAGTSQNETSGPIHLPGENTAYYESLLSRDSLNIDARIKLAALYYSKGNTEAALHNFLIVNRLDEKNRIALLNLGNLYYDTQNSSEAVRYYEKYLGFDKDNLNVRCDLATCYMNLNEMNKAITLLRGNIANDPKHPQSHYNLSVMLEKTGKQQEAAEELRIFNSLVSEKPGQKH